MLIHYKFLSSSSVDSKSFLITSAEDLFNLIDKSTWMKITTVSSKNEVTFRYTWKRKKKAFQAQETTWTNIQKGKMIYLAY